MSNSELFLFLIITTVVLLIGVTCWGLYLLCLKAYSCRRSIIIWVAGYYGHIVTIATALIGLVGLWSQLPKLQIWGYRPDDQIFFWGSVAAYVFLGLISFVNVWANRYKIEALQAEHAAAIKYYQDTIYESHRESLQDHLREIAEGLAFGMQERICVYNYIPSRNEFECVGRYSQHPTFRTYSERSRYPADMGIIAHVWTHGQLGGLKSDPNIPAMGSTNSTRKKYYKYLEETYQIPRDVAQRFRMHPVHIIAEVIRDTKDIAVAVIIFESQRRGFLNETGMCLGYNPHKKAAITSVLDKLKEQKSPNHQIAKEAQL